MTIDDVIDELRERIDEHRDTARLPINLSGGRRVGRISQQLVPVAGGLLETPRDLDAIRSALLWAAAEGTMGVADADARSKQGKRRLVEQETLNGLRAAAEQSSDHATDGLWETLWMHEHLGIANAAVSAQHAEREKTS